MTLVFRSAPLGRFIPGFTIVALLWGLAAVSAPAKKVEDLPNFHVVHPHLWRGGEPSANGVRALKEKGVQTIIDLRAVTKKSRRERALAESLGMKYVQLPMSDKAPTVQQVKTFLALTDDAKKNGGRVFIHCQHGSDRCGSMVGIYRVTRDGWTYGQAYKEMRKYWFTPKFTQLSGAVKKYADQGSP